MKETVFHCIQPTESVGSQQLQDDIATSCSRCGKCVQHCSFLKTYGTPGEIATAFAIDDKRSEHLPYSCSLCNLCTTLCPHSLPVGEMFLELRRRLVERGGVDLSSYTSLLAYVRRGKSSLFSYYDLPKQCDTVFFPGCNLPGSRPEQTLWLYEQLQNQIPNVGVVLDCCAKPTHDLGMQQEFDTMMRDLRDSLLARGIKKILLACPSCYAVFREYGSPLQVETIYEFFAQKKIAIGVGGSATLSVHDACTTRDEPAIHDAVRELLENVGYGVHDSRHSRNKTVCCGEGGAVGCINTSFAGKWSKTKSREALGNHVVAYCGGCHEFLNKACSASHIIDILRTPDQALTGNEKVARAPLTYWNRLRLKRILQRSPSRACSGDQTYRLSGSLNLKKTGYGKIVAAAIGVSIFVVVQFVMVSYL